MSWLVDDDEDKAVESGPRLPTQNIHPSSTCRNEIFLDSCRLNTYLMNISDGSNITFDILARFAVRQPRPQTDSTLSTNLHPPRFSRHKQNLQVTHRK